MWIETLKGILILAAVILLLRGIRHALSKLDSKFENEFDDIFWGW